MWKYRNWKQFRSVAVRGKKILNDGGKYYWEIKFRKADLHPPHSIMFGIGTKWTRLNADLAVDIVGEDENSWGLSSRGYLWHKHKRTNYMEPIKADVDILHNVWIGLYFDGISGTLTYFRNGICLGVAFTGLHHIKEPLYPMISTSSNIKMHLDFLKQDFYSTSLQKRCQSIIFSHVSHEEQINQLELPHSLKQSILKDL